MKVAVDTDLCEANAVCMRVCPEVFHVGENELLHIRQEQPAEALHAKVRDAVRRCPRQALSLADD